MAPTPVFLLGKSHEQRSLVGYSPWGHKTVRHNLATEHAGMVNRGSLLGMPRWMPYWKGGEMKWTHVYKMLRPPWPPFQSAESQVRAGDWKGFLWGIWPAQEERLKETDISFPSSTANHPKESHHQQVPSPTKIFQSRVAFDPLLLHSSCTPRITTYMRKVTNM